MPVLSTLDINGVPYTIKDPNAKSADWMPTAEDVGARPADWMPTAEDVKARPDTWTPSAEDVKAVPVDRKVNNHSLANDITLTAADVGARAEDWLPDLAEIKAQKLIGIGTYTGDLNDYSKLMNTVCWVNGANVTNAPSSNYGILETWSSGSGVIVQRFNSVSHTVAMRTRYSGSWAEWEWVNPNMTTDVEYRTTERYNGSVVYTKRVSLGALPSGETTITHNIENIATVLEWHLVNAGTGSNIEQSSYINSAVVSRTALTINSSANMATWNMQLIVKYTKLSS